VIGPGVALDDLAVPELVGDDVPGAFDRDVMLDRLALDVLLRYSSNACLNDDV
jgi:hypothetical protein